jgi:ABC-2 type transport system ATP-binding protein
MIETQGLGRTFGDIVAVEDLNLQVRDGEAFAFLGPNGAGKTTTVRMLCCLISSTTGKAFIDGLDTTHAPDRVKIRGMIGFLPEAPGLYESLSAERNLDFFARLYHVPEAERDQRIMDLLKTLDLWDRRGDAVGKFSKGMKQKIAIARALIHEPKYLFLDEPTSGLDPEASHMVRDFLLELKKEGRTIFLNTHNLDEAQRVCDRIGILKRRLLAIGTPENLARQYFGRTTIVHLKNLSPEMSAAVRGMPSVLDVREVEGRMLIDLEDPAKQNPLIVERLASMGGQIMYVNELRHGLEDIYLKLVREQP